MKTLFFSGLAMFSFALLTHAADPVSEHKLSDFKLGDHISGEKVKLSKLDGKVVAIEFWGTR